MVLVEMYHGTFTAHKMERKSRGLPSCCDIIHKTSHPPLFGLPAILSMFGVTEFQKE